MNTPANTNPVHGGGAITGHVMTEAEKRRHDEQPLRGHGSPYDRGDSDAYYGRPFRPHKWLDGMGRHEVTDLTEDEIREYALGNDENPSGLKDWF